MLCMYLIMPLDNLWYHKSQNVHFNLSNFVMINHFSWEEEKNYMSVHFFPCVRYQLSDSSLCPLLTLFKDILPWARKCKGVGLIC